MYYVLYSQVKKTKTFLILIILLAAVLRFYQLGSNPPSLAWDEAAWGYNAYSLGLDGRDEFGRYLPLDYLESFGDFKPPVYAYLTVLPVKIFGLNEFSTRFASALFGTLTVLLTYFLVKELLGDWGDQGDRGNQRNKIALISSFLLAISPWHIILSRAAFEANVASFFLIAGVLFFLMGVQKKGWFLTLAAFFFALSLYTFNTSRIVAPLLVIGLGLGFFRSLMKKKKWLLISLVLGSLCIAPIVPFLLVPQARLRFREVNIFSDPEVVLQANQEMANDNFAWWSLLLHNRRWGYFQKFLRHYFDHFNPSFLFIKGDGNPKFSTQDVGELYLWDLPFLIIGGLLLFKLKIKNKWLIPYWLLIAIIPAATARETPHALRIETTLPTWQILIAYGVVNSTELLRRVKLKKVFKSLICVFGFSFLVFNFVYFQHGYWRHYPYEFSGEWQYGYKEAIEFVKEVEKDYDQIFFTRELGRPYIYFLFYLQEDPQKFRQEAKVEREVYGYVKVKSYGKYHFFEKPELGPQEKILSIEKAREDLKDLAPIKTFYLLNNKEILKAFKI